MDHSAHRHLQAARNLLMDRLIEAPNLSLDADQRAVVLSLCADLWTLMSEDPSPPMCQTCATPITQPLTGRPRLYCSSACRSAAAHCQGF